MATEDLATCRQPTPFGKDLNPHCEVWFPLCVSRGHHCKVENHKWDNRKLGRASVVKIMQWNTSWAVVIYCILKHNLVFLLHGNFFQVQKMCLLMPFSILRGEDPLAWFDLNVSSWSHMVLGRKTLRSMKKKNPEDYPLCLRGRHPWTFKAILKCTIRTTGHIWNLCETTGLWYNRPLPCHKTWSRGLPAGTWQLGDGCQLLLHSTRTVFSLLQEVSSHGICIFLDGKTFKITRDMVPDPK